MKVLRNSTIRQLSSRFSIGFALVVVCVAAIGYFNVKTAGQLNEDWSENPNNARLKGSLLHNLNTAIGYGGAIHQFKNFVLRKDAPRLKKVHLGFDTAQETILKYRAFNLTDDELRALDDISSVFRQYSEATSVITKMAKNNMSTNDIDKAVKIDDSPAIAGIKLLEASIDSQLESQDLSMDSKLEKIYSLAMYGSIASTVMLCILLTSLLITFRSILKQIGGEPRQIKEIARGIANGDHVEVPDGADNNSGILGAVHSMNLVLTDVVSKIQSSAKTVKSSAAEISKGNQELSASTDNQVVRLNETSFKVSELTSTVKQNTKHAMQASALAKAARSRAEDSNDIITSTVAAMTDINNSSDKISNIIGVIDEIAFQTNLLALNAAVEAARAGESGRGFAVVASEVRSLAGRSAEAAREVKTLITDSNEKVELGNQLVHRSRDTLSEIVTEVTRVSEVVNEIAAASEQQSISIDNVSQTIEVMNQLTEKNSELVGKLANAGGLLSSEADALSGMTAFFNSKQNV